MRAPHSRALQQASPNPTTPTTSIIIPAYSLDRWSLLVDAVHACQHQTLPPAEILLAIDRNPDLLQRCHDTWSHRSTPKVTVLDGTAPIDDTEARVKHGGVHGAQRRFGAGAARNSAARQAAGDILVFIDDDATPSSDWLCHLIAPYSDSTVMAVGGAPIPKYDAHRPKWFPSEFNWVFGCAYTGMPTTIAPFRRLIGANMSVRADAFATVGGFGSIDFDDLDICQRLAHHYGPDALLYQPAAVVHHHVPQQRLTWSYFWRRCFYVNRYKITAFRDLGAAGSLAAERSFVYAFLNTLPRRTAQALLTTNTSDILQISTAILGLAFAATGHIAGRTDALRGTASALLQRRAFTRNYN